MKTNLDRLASLAANEQQKTRLLNKRRRSGVGTAVGRQTRGLREVE